MIKAGFVGFGEVNTPKEIIVKKCAAAHDLLHTQGIDTVSVYPVTDDYEERDIAHALDVLGSEDFDCLVLCVAGWIPTHAVIKITEHYRHIPMVLWGLCGWVEGDRLVTTADQARCAEAWHRSAIPSAISMISSGCRHAPTGLRRTAERRARQSACVMLASASAAIAI